MHCVRALRSLVCLRGLATLGEFAILITRHCFAIRTVTTIAVATATAATTTWRIFAILDSTTFGLWREQISLHCIVIKTSHRCGQYCLISLHWLAFFARCTGLTLTSFTGFAWFTWFALRFGLALVSCLFGFECFFRLALLLGGFGFCACTFFLFVATATAATTATTGAATAIVSNPTKVLPKLMVLA